MYIHYTGESTKPLAKELVKSVYRAGGAPFIHYTDPQLQRLQIMECTKEQMELMARVDALEMSNMDCYIAVRGSDNVSELSDVPADRMALYEKYYVTPVHHKIRVQWRSFPGQAQKLLKIFILKYATWITVRWSRP